MAAAPLPPDLGYPGTTAATASVVCTRGGGGGCEVDGAADAT